MPIKTKLASLEPARNRLRVSIKLVSGAYYARQALPNGMITVYPWGFEEDLWFQEQRTKNPNVLWELLPKLCDLNGVDVNTIPLGDMITILTVARSITFDCKLEYDPVCPSCGTKNQRTTVKIPDGLVKVGEKGPDYPGWDEIKLPQSEDLVRLRPLTVGDERAITSRSPEAAAKVSDPTMRMLAAVVSIGGGTPESLDELLTWWRALHPADHREFTQRQDELFPHLEEQFDHECDKCRAKFRVPAPLDTGFFR